MHMPKDRPDQETFDDGTSYLFGPETAPETSNEAMPDNSASTVDIGEEFEAGASPAAGSTQCNRLEPPTHDSTIEARSDDFDTSVAPPGLSLTNGPQPGDLLFGRYRVERLLGRGGMGEVWLVRHQILRDEFALKLIVPGVAIDDETVKRFVLEAQVMRALSRHPHAVVVHDADIDMNRNAIYIVMDVVHGRSIDKQLRTGVAMPLDWTTQVLGQLCDVLHQAHERGIVHRDLSPGNLMLEDSSDGRVHLRVLDFGIAKVLDPESGIFEALPLTEFGRFFGKRSYASPEQLNGERVDRRSDIYSLGVILYEFLTGYRPFHGNAGKLLVDHCTADPPRFAKINPAVNLPGVEQVVRRCLEKKPENRPQTALELFELFRAAAHKSVRSRPVELPKRPREKPYLRVRAAVIASTILVCVGAAILVAGSFRDGHPPPPPPPNVAEALPEVVEYLRTLALRPITGTGVNVNGCPKVVERVADGRRLVWHQGVYLPEGYEPALDQGKSGQLPLVLVGKRGSRFLLVEGREFVMGAFDESIKDFYSEEKPGHRVGLSSFYIQQTETTFGEFEDFCKETARDRNHADLKDGYSYAWATLLMKMSEDELRRHPAVGVTRKLAEVYAHHVGGDLPTEAQWEFAARSRGKHQLYVWGNNLQFPNLVNIKKPVVVGIETLPVGLSTDDHTEQGVLDLAGNVREWCRDVWKVYPQVEPDRDPVQGSASEDENSFFVIRGGSYDTDRETARTTWRADVPGKAYRAKNDYYELDLGFRVVLEVLEVPENLITHSESKAGSTGERAR
jgi:serine/threonine protein kinase/formylglycine-generating enzyme required for sulfatase activity